jgi:hypothetical protein
MAMIIDLPEATLTTMDLDEFGPWLRRNNLIVTDVVPNTWPPQLVCQPKDKDGGR